MDPQHHAKHEPGPDLDPSDRELIDRVRDGDLEAFDPLYRRHRDSGLRHARHWTRSEPGAEDLCAEAFTRVLHAIRNGNGPTEAFRPYLLTAMRNVACDWAEGDRRVLLVPDVVDIAPPEPDQDPVIAALERSLAGTAFGSLPERWQTVLWQTEVEQEAPGRLAAQLGIDAAAVSALAYRAREGLRQAYLQAHITEIGSPSCRPYAERLGTHTRGKLSGREAAKLRHHLRHCGECLGLFAMLKYVNGNLGALVGPAVLGAAAALRIGIAVGGAGVAAGAGAGGAGAAGGAAQHGLVLRTLSKARHASPRQQAVAVGAGAAVAAAALALALTGNDSPPPPVAAAKPSLPVIEPTAPPSPKTAPPSPKATPKPATTPPPIVATSAPSGSQPAPAMPAPAPTASASAVPTTALPSPSQSPTVRVLCPGYTVEVVGVQVGLPVSLRVDLPLGPGGTRLGDVVIAVNAAGEAACSSDGPPHPDPLPDAAAGGASAPAAEAPDSAAASPDAAGDGGGD